MKQLDDPHYQNLIMPDQLQKKLEEGEDVTVYFYSPTCPHCAETTPKLMPLAKEQNVDIQQFNLLEFEDGWNEYQIEYTPTLVHFENGKEKARIVGGQPPEKYKQFFKEHIQ